MKKLSVEQVKIAREKALRNAKDLIKDAELLYANARWPRVVFLCQIAGEEIGKHILLSSLTIHLIAGDEINWKRVWKRLTSHREKLEMVTYLEDVFLEQPFTDTLNEYFSELKDEVQQLETFKQKSLYCDFTQEIPHCPTDIIKEEYAQNAIKWAKGRSDLFSKIEEGLKDVNVLDKISKKDIEKFRQRMEIEHLFNKTCG